MLATARAEPPASPKPRPREPLSASPRLNSSAPRFTRSGCDDPPAYAPPTPAPSSSSRSARVAFDFERPSKPATLRTPAHRRGSPYARPSPAGSASSPFKLLRDSSDPNLLVPTPQRLLSSSATRRSILKHTGAPIILVGSAEEGRVRNAPRRFSLTHIDDFAKSTAAAPARSEMPALTTADALAVLAKANAQPNGPAPKMATEPSTTTMADADVFGALPVVAVAMRAAGQATFADVRTAYDSLYSRLRQPALAAEAVALMQRSSALLVASLRRDLGAVLEPASIPSPQRNDVPSSDEAVDATPLKRRGRNEADVRRWKALLEVAQASIKVVGICTRVESAADILNGASAL